jgi:hypothetical protein
VRGRGRGNIKHEGKRERRKQRHQLLLCALSQKSFLSSSIITIPGGQLMEPNSHKLYSVSETQPALL